MSGSPLVSKSSSRVFYDEACLLVMDRQIAQGFVTILGGRGLDAGDTGIDESKVTLGFLALTEGNAVDACFGVSSISSKDAKGKKMAKEVKRLLATAADSNEAIRRMAVLTYQQAFLIVVRFNDKTKKLNWFTRCFCYGKLQKQAIARLKENFAHLEEAVQSAL
jgi:hypothetical protein